MTVDGLVKTLTDEAEGVKFKLTDGVDVARDGLIYFTDASYKYNLEEHLMDILEGRPYGRLLSFDPSTKETKVLVRDLFFPNGVVVSPDQNSLIFCETVMYVSLSLRSNTKRLKWVLHAYTLVFVLVSYFINMKRSQTINFKKRI